jgi:hypothetical protein
LIEAAQVLSSVWGGPYRATHANHPAMIWVKSDWRHYDWLLWHYFYLGEEWNNRFDKRHAAGRWVSFFNKMLKENAPKAYSYADIELRITFQNMTPFKNLEVHEAYKECLREKWLNDKRPPKWTNREKPLWA